MYLTDHDPMPVKPDRRDWRKLERLERRKVERKAMKYYDDPDLTVDRCQQFGYF